MYLISTYSEIGPTMNASNYELEFDLNKVHIPIVEEIIGMLDERTNATGNEPIEEADNVQIGDVVVDRV